MPMAARTILARFKQIFPEYLPVLDSHGLRESSNRGIPISRLKQNIR